MRFLSWGIIGAACVALTLGSAARAADFPTYQKAPSAAESVYNWSGFHIGLNGGYGFSDRGDAVSGANAIGALVVATGAVSSPNPNAKGFIGGAQIGYDHQFGSWVYGLEADFQGSALQGSDSRVLSAAPLGAPFSLTTNGASNLEWYGTIRGKVGFTPVDRLLLFVTGGGAYGKITDSTSIVLGAPAPIGTSVVAGMSDTKFGYVVGVGAEYGIARNLTIFTKYEYLDFGSHTDAMNAVVAKTPVNFMANQRDDFHTIKFGVDYKFGS